MVRSAFQAYFSFTKKEMNGIAVLCVLLMVMIFAPIIYGSLLPDNEVDFTKYKHEIAYFREAEVKRKARFSYNRVPRTFNRIVNKPVYFNFNPNGLSPSLWAKLGLSERQINVIKNFEAKGGHFYRKDDLRKIFSITEHDYQRLERYMIITPAIKPSGIPKHTIKYSGLPLIELNYADSAMLEKLPGIGPAFAIRILKYRNRLGGFYRKEQLLEVYGLDSAVYSNLAARITIDPSVITKLNINTVDFDGLKRHPYLSYKQVNAILQYRKQHGSFSSLEDLEKIEILDQNILVRLGPYLSF